MNLRLRNTLGGAIEPFEPLEPGHVRMYSCGPTVYAPSPWDSQRVAPVSPARRVVSTIRSATMNAE